MRSGPIPSDAGRAGDALNWYPEGIPQNGHDDARVLVPEGFACFRGWAVPLDGGWQQHFDLPAERVVPAPRRGMNGRQGRAATRRIDALIAAISVRLSPAAGYVYSSPGGRPQRNSYSDRVDRLPWVDGAAGVRRGRSAQAARLRARIGTSPDVPRPQSGGPSQSCKGRTRRQIKRLDFQSRADARVVRIQAGRCTENRAGCSGGTAS